MKARNLTLCAGMCLGMAGVALAGDKPQLQTAGPGTMVQAVRYAPVSMIDGQPQIVGEWKDYQGGQGNSRASGFLWDCFQADTAGAPIGGLECGLPGDGYRWYFGSAYHNPFSVNDMSMDDGNEGTFATRSGFAWYWTAPAPTQCYVLVFTSDEYITDACDSTPAGGDGWAFDFGILNPGGYYYTNVDFGDGSTDGWDMPADGDGTVIHALCEAFDGTFFYITSFPSQFMLWGTADGGGLPGRPGTQTLVQHDDDFPVDGVHTIPDECYYYDFGICPDPLGSMIYFWGEPGSGGPCYVDCNGDTVINSQDFLCFLNLYTSQNPLADCNGDTVINSQDFLCFLNLYNNPPCP